MATKKKAGKNISKKKATKKSVAKRTPSFQKKKSRVKKSSQSKSRAHKKAATRASSKKKTTKKSATKKTTKKAKQSTQKKASKKTTKRYVKKPARKKVAQQKKVARVKKTTPARKKPSTAKSSAKELREMSATLNEIRALELDNKQLERQISKAQTKQEILSELKTYLALLKQAPAPTPANKEEFKEQDPQLQELQNKLEHNKEALEEKTQQAQSKEKLITRLKNLLAMKNKDSVKDEKEIANQEQLKEITYQQQSPTQDLPRPPKAPQEQTPTQDDETTNEDDEVQVSIDESISKAAQEIKRVEPKRKKETFKESDFKTHKTRGILTIEEAQEYSDMLKLATKEVNRVFLGQEKVVEQVIISVVCDAHTLLEGVPGLAKTLLIETLAKVIDGTTFKRIQFLPDLLPSDIIGGQVFNPKTAEYKIYKGPIFANFVLCDEINRAPPKTHAAVMEAMQEKKINIENEEFILDRPFFVLATQNPLENKGTYDLPEAVLDRFMFKVLLDYPRREIEHEIITENATTKNLKLKIRKALDKETLLEMQKKIKTVHIAEKIRNYILDLVEASRGKNKDIEGFKFVKYGAGVRASIYLSLAAKAKAVVEGRNYVLPDDVDFVAPAVLRHRIALNYRGKAHNITSDKIADEILLKVKAI